MPTPDGVAVDGLARLPLAWSLDGARIALGKQTRVVPLQPGGVEHATDGWLWLIDELFIVDFNETLRRQHTPPVRAQSLVGADETDQCRTPGGERQSRVEMGLVNRERRVERAAAAMDY